MKNTMTADRINDMRKIISDRRERSAWNKGVKAYALELLDNLTDHIGDEIPDDHFSPLTVWLLGGADSWEQYSEGGGALIYNVDIADRLCTASGLKQTHNGERNPNSRETWLDVQSRALSQAAIIVHDALKASAVWYAALRDDEDNDHSNGSFDPAEAVRIARQYRRDGYRSAYVIAVDPDDDYCLAEYRDLEEVPRG